MANWFVLRDRCGEAVTVRVIVKRSEPLIAGDMCRLPGSEWNPLCAGRGEAGTMFAKSRVCSGLSGKRGSLFCWADGTHLMDRLSPDGFPGVFQTLYSLKTSSLCASSILPRQKHI